MTSISSLAPHAKPPRELSILVVEDEVVIAMYMQDLLIEMNCKVALASRVAKALQMIEDQPFDGAFLDVSVFGMPVYPVVRALLQRRIPFAFVTGYEAKNLPADLRGFRILPKPISERRIFETVATFARFAPAEPAAEQALQMRG
jgi:CheY-like chemotaxis protein